MRIARLVVAALVSAVAVACAVLAGVVTFYLWADDAPRNRGAVPPTVVFAVVVVAVAIRTIVLIIRAERRRNASTSWFRSLSGFVYVLFASGLWFVCAVSVNSS
jgi:predicted tellurium resistance membrane protein TerC